jgi:hypothetical protein
MNHNIERTTTTTDNFKSGTTITNATNTNTYTTTGIPSLIHLCRTVVTNNIERYAPESFQICDVYEWEEIIKLRYTLTQPKKVTLHLLQSPSVASITSTAHSNGSSTGTDLDGNGRLIPAISVKVIQSIEACNVHLADCTVTDTLVWKDCVEYRFKRNVGLHIRPPILFLPWPLLVQEIQHYTQILASLLTDDENDNDTNSSSYRSKPSIKDINIAIQKLQSTTWNIALLRDTGVGKVVKKVLKKFNKSNSTSSSSATNDKNQNHQIHMDDTMKNTLQQLLNDWMGLVSSSNSNSNSTNNNNSNRTTTNGNSSNQKPKHQQQKQQPSSASSSVGSTNIKSSTNSSPITTIVTCTAISTTPTTPSSNLIIDERDDLQLLESCLSWRQLYHLLEQRKMIIQSTQGKRMREIRHHVRLLVFCFYH